METALIFVKLVLTQILSRRDFGRGCFLGNSSSVLCVLMPPFHYFKGMGFSSLWNLVVFPQSTWRFCSRAGNLFLVLNSWCGYGWRPLPVLWGPRVLMCFVYVDEGHFVGPRRDRKPGLRVCCVINILGRWRICKSATPSSDAVFSRHLVIPHRADGISGTTSGVRYHMDW